MNKFLESLLTQRKEKLAKLQERNNAATSVDEVRSIGNEIMECQEEIRNIEAQLANLPSEERGLNPTASYTVAGNITQRNDENVTDPRGTMEYRQAFMDYVRTGAMSDKLEMRVDAANASSDLGVLLPSTVVDKIITGVQKVYGQLYSRVKKTNLKGGVKYPIGSFSATFKRITETGAPTDRQKAGSVTSYVEFTYKLGEIRIAQTLLANVLSVPVFEAELAKVIVEAYVKAMDAEIMNGVGSSNQCEGILTEAAKGGSGRIPVANIIEFSPKEMADWKTWQTKLFSVIPLSMRSMNPEFVMTAHTYEANIKTLVDANNRPVYSETYNPVDGAESARFKGRNVVFVEEDILKNFNDAVTGEYFAMLWVPEEAYAINTNLEFAVKRYFDEEKLQYVDRAIVINDGKVLDGKYIYLLKKSADTVAVKV